MTASASPGVRRASLLNGCARYGPAVAAPSWFVDMLGWKTASKKATARCVRLFGVARGPNLADLSSTSSAAIAGRVYTVLGVPTTKHSDVDLGSDDTVQASSGSALERALERDLRDQLQAIERERDWKTTRSGSVSQFAQYSHLADLQFLFEQDETLRSALGRDYEVSTDVMVSLPDPNHADHPRTLHAAVSSKLTIRSDRVQNIRFEFNTLVRNRKGRLPHLVVVTAEPLPSRLVSIARGTGEIDAVYHLLYDEMDEVMAIAYAPEVATASWTEQRNAWHEMVTQKRIRPYGDLVPVLGAG